MVEAHAFRTDSRGRVALAAAALLASAGHAHAQLASFAGAPGFGGNATRERGGSIYAVTNLNDSGAGSFRDAVSASNRIIVFAVNGYINLQSAVSAKSNLTILGQAAPGQGIGLEGCEVSFSDQSNCIIQYLRLDAPKLAGMPARPPLSGG